MKITQCTYEDSDWRDEPTMEFQVEAVLENQSDFDIEFVTTSMLVVNRSGCVIGGSENRDDRTFISSKDSGAVEMNCDAVRAAVGGSGSDTKCYISASLYKREFIKVGSFDFPRAPGELSELKGNVSLGGVAELMGASCIRFQDDEEDGDCKFEFYSGVRNTSESYIARAQLSVRLMDQRDALVEENIDYSELAAKGMYVFNPSFFGIKPGKLKNAKFDLTASVFVPVETFTAEAVPVHLDD